MPKKMQLPAGVPDPKPQAVAAPGYYPSYPPTQQFTPEATTSLPLSHYIWILERHAWKMVAFVAVCMLVTFVVSKRIKPVYESTVTIDVDMQAPNQVVGQGSNSAGSGLDPDTYLSTQIRLIESDSVLRPVAEQFHLGKFKTPAAGDKSKSSASASDAPVSLGGLKVVRPTGTSLLLISYRAQDPRVAADIANAVADSYISHLYDIRIRSSANMSMFMEKQLDELKAKMERSGLALAQYQKDIEVISPDQKTDILSSRLTQLNTEYTAAQAERIRQEAAWNAMQSGSVEAAEISNEGGQSLVTLANAVNDAKAHLAEVKATYGMNHPEYQKAASTLAAVEKEFDDTYAQSSKRIAASYKNSLAREQTLQKAVADTKGQWDDLNSRTAQYQQLKQEADADKALYDELVKKIREADINEGFRDNDVRIADPARPIPGPVFPNTKRNLEVMFFLSLILAVGSAILLDSLDTTLRDPEKAGRYLGADIIGSLPLDRESVQLPITARQPAAGESAGDNEHGEHRKGYYRRISGYEEAIRTVRNTILLADLDQRLSSIVLTSAEPGEGKTTFAVHFALSNAARGKKTLLVDGDLRRPSVHSKFVLNPREGLSNVLTGTLAWQDAVIPVEGKPNLSLLPSGPGSHRAADLIGPKLAELLDEFAKEYDLVVLDAPPLLGFAEGLQMATAADGVVIICRAGETKRKAVAAVVTTLQRVRANILGVVLNRVSYNTSEDGESYYGHFRYQNYRAPE